MVSTSQHTITPAGGVAMPRIVYGTAWKKHETERLVAEAIRCGFRGIDTACQPKHYDEAGVGRGIARCLGPGLARGDLYLQTKFTAVDGQDPARIPYDPRAPLPDQVEQSFEASLSNLATSYVDALVLHAPLPGLDPTLEAWQALERIAGHGGARQLGISNCYSPELLEQLHRSASVKPVIVQNRFYGATGYDREIRAFCRAHGMVYESFWTLTANPHLLADPVTRRIASDHGYTPAQVLFRYLTQQDVVPLTGTTSEAHMREDLAIFESTLTEAEQAAMTGLLE